MFDESDAEAVAEVNIGSVLIVDDDAAHAARLAEVLEASHIVPRLAHDLGQASVAFRMYKPDFVVTELLLPQRTGFELCEWIKQTSQTVPVMALTVIDLDRSRDLAARVGADAYFTKPLSAERCLEMINEVARRFVERMQSDDTEEEPRAIEFHCRCGKRHKRRYRHGGKFTHCSSCGEKVMVPHLVMNDATEGTFHRGDGVVDDDGRDDPRRYLNLRCPSCNVTFAIGRRKGGVCPSCKEPVSGTLRVAGDAVTRAVLVSSRRVVVVRSGEFAGKKMLLPAKGVTIGSGKQNRLRLTAKGIAEEQCRLVSDTEGIRVENLGGGEQVLVGDDVVESSRVAGPGETISVGPLKLQVARNRRMDRIEKEVERLDSELGDEADPDVSPSRMRHATPEEAAEVVQLHCELVRRRAAAGGVE